MRLAHLWLEGFRNLAPTELSLPPGLLAVVGDNGAGKTNLLEAVGYLATLESFRGATTEAMVGVGRASAVVRGQGERGGRSLLIETELAVTGRSRARLNRQPVRRAGDLDEALRVSVFGPDDLVLVKGGPSGRRRYLDDVLGGLHPRQAAARRDYERVVRQRNALLAGIAARGGRPDSDAATTLDVWDARLVQTGERLGEARAEVVGQLEPVVAKAYAELAPGSARGGGAAVTVGYQPSWRADGLAAALAGARAAELRRGVSLVGPHRDEVELAIDGLPARTHASQGEQRSLALALRLGAHALTTEALGEAPVLLLDDVFSELDATRARALLAHLPPGQAVLTTAGPLPDVVTPEQVARLAEGRLQP